MRINKPTINTEVINSFSWLNVYKLVKSISNIYDQLKGFRISPDRQQGTPTLTTINYKGGKAKVLAQNPENRKLE